MSPSRHVVWMFEELYREIKGSYDIRRAELENLIVDHELIREGWKLHFVVDFYQIFTFAFPLGLEEISLLQNERERSRVAMMQAARAFVFYGLKVCPYPVLISPYAIELRNWLSLVLSKGHDTVLATTAIRDWGQSLLTKEQRELINKAISWYKLPNREEKLPPELLSQMMDLVDKKFLDMYFLISGAMIEGIRILRDLYRGKESRLQGAHRRWKNYDEMTREVRGGHSSSWYPRFAKIRRARTIPNIRDALAIEIVMALNHHLMKKKKKLCYWFQTQKLCMKYSMKG